MAPIAPARLVSFPARRISTDPIYKSVEVAQRARMVLDVSALDLQAAEAHFGHFHETTLYFRAASAEARRAWDRLRALYGSRALESALGEPPLTVLSIGATPDGDPLGLFVPIAGGTYRVERVLGTTLAPAQWRLTRIPEPLESPYYTCRLADKTLQCDCGEWIYERAEVEGAGPCKHLTALGSLGWI